MKKFVLLTCVLLFTGVLSGCFQPAPPPQAQPQPRAEPFAIEVKVDQPVYQVGDYITVIVRANRECHLSLYNVSTQGEVTQIFPNRFAQDGRIRAEQIYYIPAESDTFDFEIEGPPGTERVRAVGTMENVNFFEPGKQATDEDFPIIQKTPEEFDSTINQKLEGMSPAQWAEASVSFEVQ